LKESGKQAKEEKIRLVW